MTKLVLASSSAYRKQLLANIGIPVETYAPAIDETPLPDESPIDLATRLASAKAQKVAHRYPEHIVIGSDQVALVETSTGKHLLGKPGTVENAVAQLKMCQNKTVSFYTALTVCRFAQTDSEARCVTQVEETSVFFRQHSEAQLRAYVEAERPLDCAGSFKCEGMGVLLFERITSRDPNTLIGLPIMLLHNLLDKHFDIDLLDIATSRLACV
ncbi:septum formation protein Maf [Alteromonas sp. 345S023]|jgi:septum formation protein|uniref:7-methyl-GTP pyrophosphatase n=1 Tax=Alteromonas profundi TaxID=2696062 RepID=A0A7X5RJM5_9ALTE|nr:nucleoside triphosphate pyrophosphatase [Alteromonas profundi]NDV90033.1 septum formation protein Maf [Alteromonas profundi]